MLEITIRLYESEMLQIRRAEEYGKVRKGQSDRDLIRKSLLNTASRLNAQHALLEVMREEFPDLMWSDIINAGIQHYEELRRLGAENDLNENRD
jgi:hypothetical protein